MSIYSSGVDHELLRLSYGFNDNNTMLYDFIVSYFYRSQDKQQIKVDIKDYHLLFTDLIPNRLFSDIVHFIATKHNTSLSTQIINTIKDFPVFKKLKKDNNLLQPTDEQHIKLLRTMYESYYQIDRKTKQVTHMCLPKATFDRFLQLLLNPLDYTTSLCSYFNILSKLFIPLPMVNSILTIPFENFKHNTKTIKIDLLFEKVCPKNFIDTNKYSLQPQLEVFIKPDSEIVRTKELQNFVSKVRNIMAYNFDFDKSKDVDEDLPAVNELKDELVLKQNDPDINSSEESDYSDVASANESNDHHSESDSTSSSDDGIDPIKLPEEIEG